MSYKLRPQKASEGTTYEGVTSAPEGVRLVLPLPLLLVLLPPVTEGPERVDLSVRRVGEELAVDTRVEQPVD